MMFPMMAYQLVQTLYWLSLAIWFGGTLFLGISWPVIFNVLREEDPTLPRVLSVNVDHDHAGLLSGTLVGALIRHFGRIQLICAGVLLASLVAQWFVVTKDHYGMLAGVARCTLFVGAAGLLIADRFSVWPRVWAAREAFIENADDPEIANPIRERFNQLQLLSIRYLLLQLTLLSLMIVFSVMIRQGL
jgi:hypothetical protein